MLTILHENVWKSWLKRVTLSSTINLISSLSTHHLLFNILIKYILKQIFLKDLSLYNF